MSEVDILIAGGGYVGLSAALACKQAQPGLSIMVVDPIPPHVKRDDNRASAIALSAEKMLRQMGIWSTLEPEAQPINDMIVTDSRTEDAVRPIYLTFEEKVEDGRPFAHMVPNALMVNTLEAKAIEAGVDVRRGESVIDFVEIPGSMEASLAGGEKVATKLLVAADGARSGLRDLAGIRTVSWDYGQSGIVTTVKHEMPHHGRAVEHFLPAGPFAMLPLTGNRSSLVWTEKTHVANRLVEGDEFVFETELERRFGHQLGEIEVVGKRHAYPLGLTLAKEFVRPRFALIGDAAHGVHPIAGQGLNLGFRDVAAFAETIIEADRLGLDIGSLATLERYQQWRRFDTWAMGAMTDSLNRLFSNDLAPLRLLRTVGLGLVDRMPRAKKFFIDQAAGLRREQPRLLQGEAL